MKSGWISPWWQAFALPDEWDVCGVAVPPLSVWHVFALCNLGNAYLTKSTPDLDDAASLLLICSKDMAKGKELLLPNMANKRCRNIIKMAKRIKGLDAEYIERACGEYVDTCTRTPSRFSKGGGTGHPPAVPFTWHIVMLMSDRLPGGLTAAWNMPYAYGACLYDAYAEMKGDDSILSTAAQEMEDNWEYYKGIKGTKQIELVGSA